jgi:hypothetical protein
MYAVYRREQFYARLAGEQMQFPVGDTMNVSTRLQLTYTLQLEQKVINSDVAVSLRILCHL